MPDSAELLKMLAFWEEKEAAAERALTYAQIQRNRILGELAAQGVVPFPPVEYENEQV